MRQILISLFSLLIVIIFWELLVTNLKIEKWILPSPLLVINTLIESRKVFFLHLIPTLIIAILGLLLSILVGVYFAYSMKLFKFVQEILSPFLVLSQTIPFIVFAPLLSLWFGFGLFPKILLVVIVCFFPITFSLLNGFEVCDKEFAKLLNSMNATKWQKMRYLYWPGSLSTFFSGLKISASYAILSAVVSEWMGSDKGLGILLLRASRSYATETVFAVIFLVSSISVGVVLFINTFEKTIMPWNKNVHSKESFI